MAIPTEQELIQSASTELTWRQKLASFIAGDYARQTTADQRDIVKTQVMAQGAEDVQRMLAEIQAEKFRQLLSIECEGLLKCMELLPEFSGGNVTPEMLKKKLDAAQMIWIAVKSEAYQQALVMAQQQSQNG